MGACDMVITKAGPGTMAEALIAGLPIMLNGFVPGQEEVRHAVQRHSPAQVPSSKRRSDEGGDAAVPLALPVLGVWVRS